MSFKYLYAYINMKSTYIVTCVYIMGFITKQTNTHTKNTL